MVEDVARKVPLQFSSQGLLVQGADGAVYFFNNAIVDSCRERGLSRKQKTQTKKFFDDLRKGNRLVDAAFVPTFHIFEGAG
jgi:hypothetical protein